MKFNLLYFFTYVFAVCVGMVSINGPSLPPVSVEIFAPVQDTLKKDTIKSDTLIIVSDTSYKYTTVTRLVTHYLDSTIIVFDTVRELQTVIVLDTAYKVIHLIRTDTIYRDTVILVYDTLIVATDSSNDAFPKGPLCNNPAMNQLTGQWQVVSVERANDYTLTLSDSILRFSETANQQQINAFDAPILDWYYDICRTVVRAVVPHPIDSGLAVIRDFEFLFEDQDTTKLLLHKGDFSYQVLTNGDTVFNAVWRLRRKL